MPRLPDLTPRPAPPLSKCRCKVERFVRDEGPCGIHTRWTIRSECREHFEACSPEVRQAILDREAKEGS